MACNILILLSFGLTIISNRNIESKNVSKKAVACYIPDGCSCYEPNRKTLDRNLYCNNLYARIDYQKLKESSYNLCMPDSPDAIALAIHFNRNDYTRRLTLNNSFELLKIEPYLITKMSIFYYYYFKPRFFFHNLRGFHANLRLPVDYRGAGFVILDTDFNFFSAEKTLIRTCEAYRNASGSQPRNLFWNATFISDSLDYDLFFEKCRFPTPVCPLVFQNARILQITILYLTR